MERRDLIVGVEYFNSTLSLKKENEAIAYAVPGRLGQPPEPRSGRALGDHFLIFKELR
jgi:hypothetical protein